MRTILMFKLQQTVRSSFLSFLFVALSLVRPLPEKKTCFSSDPLFRSINSQSHCRQLLSIYPLLCLAAFSSLLRLSLSQQIVKSQCYQDGQWHSFTVLLLSPHVCLSFPLSLHLCLLEGRSRCPSFPPPSLGG